MKKIFMMTLILMIGLCSGCGKEKTESNNLSTEGKSTQVEKQSNSENRENNNIELNDELEIDFTYDYSADIKADVDNIVSNSDSLQKELKNIDEITKKYDALAETAQTQGEMNVASQWLFTIWDTELNNLWSRFSSLADQETKESILEEQRNWIAMKEEVILESIGSDEENGSIYPLLKNSLLEEITKDRAYVLADKLAELKTEKFIMPEKSEKYGIFVDNQGTDSVYSFLNTQSGLDGEDEAIISIYRQGELEGTFVDNGNGELDFTSDDGSVKGTIHINGWDGASFKVTETFGMSGFLEGEEFEFPFAF